MILAALLLVAGFAHAEQDYLNQEKRAEAALLASLPAVHREGARLTIKTSSRPLIFEDNDVEGESHGRFILTQSYAPASDRRDYLVRGFGHESHSWTLVNGKTGEQAELYSTPLLSPDKKHYLSWSFDVEVGYAPNAVGIHSVKTLKPVFDYSYPNGSASGPLEASWVSPAKVMMTELTLKPDGTTSRRTLSIERIDGILTGPKP